ncbi:MAG: hypothetical protein NC200_05975, partial [Candidatus Gastranaerophilales bacterium]|nr:hypothetical protein [Candidatus Gastranaerophilales bacterium]
MRKIYPVIAALLYVLCTFSSMSVSAETVSDKTYTGKNDSAYTNTNTAVMHHVTFTDNKATTSGGGIYNKNTGVIQLIDGNSLFEENHAKYGGAIYNYKVGTINRIVDTIFKQNTAKSQGGAIYSAGYLSHIENSSFISNDAWGDTTKEAGYGGAIYANKDLTITNSIFRDNHAYRKGGAIALKKGNLTLEAKGNGAKTEFRDNVQGYLGSSTSNDVGNDIYMGGSNQNLYLNAYDVNASVILNSGVDFNKGLTIYVNKPANQNETASGTVVLGGDVGTSSKRVNLYLNGGTMSFINNEINNVYANKVTINSDTALGFDINLMTGELDYDRLYLNSVTGTGKFIITADSFNIMSNFTEESESAVLRLIYASSSNFKSYINMFDDDGNKTNIIYIRDEEGNKLYKVKLASDGTLIFSNVYYIDQITNPLAYAVNYNDNNSYTLTLTKNIVADSWEDIDPGNPRNKLIVDELYIVGKNKTITAENNLVGIDVDNSIADAGVTKYLNVNSTIFTGFDRAITNNGGLVDLYYSGFKGNNSIKSKENGAALANISGVMNITGTAKSTKSLFYNNEAVNGGAVFNSGEMNIIYSNFGAVPTKKATYSNIATNGGAIYNSQYDVVSETNLSGFDTNLKITSSNFVDNVANKGGAIYNTYADGEAASEAVQITSSTFTHNEAKDLGGAIYNEGNIEVITSNFGNKSKKAAYANTAVNGGAAVANMKNGRFVSSNTNYYYSSGDNGGAILNTDNATAIIQGGTFANNSATNGDRNGTKGNGGAIYNDENATLSLDRYTYYTISKGNTVEKYAYLTFSANTALNGGAIYNLGSLVPTNYDVYGMPTDIAGTFSKNTATYGNQNYTISAPQKEDASIYITPKGGAIYNNGTLTLSNASFTSNSANSKVTFSVKRYMDGYTPVTEQITRFAGQGGAVYNASSEDVNILNTTFSKNSASAAGGAVYNENANSTLHITNSDFSSNTSRTLVTTVQTQEIQNGAKTKTKKVTIKKYIGDGGAIYSKGDVEINTSEEYQSLVRTTSFKSNTAVNGGAIYADGTVDSYLATFTSNKANGNANSDDGNGGAIYSKDDVRVKNNTFSKNTATGIGGAIAGKNIDVIDSTFSSNKANGNGGAIYADGDITVNANDYVPNEEGIPYIGASSFTSNTALNGGAIYAAGTALIKDTTFTSNKASKGNGGALYAGGDIRVINSTFNKNSASYGGAVYVEDRQTATFINTSFTGNSASKAGGAIYVGNGATVNIVAYDKDVTISGNKAAGKANSIYLDDNAKVYLDAWDHTSSGGGKYTITLGDGVTGTGNNNDMYLRGNGNFNITKNITNISSHDEAGVGAHIILDVESLIQSSSMYFSGNSTFCINNNRIGTVAFKTLGLPDNTTTNVSIDMDLQSG